jgi:hypothetical protein
VKELGADQALIFYEGLRPVKCQKIRYFADARFRARLLPPPPRAIPGPRAQTGPHGHRVGPTTPHSPAAPSSAVQSTALEHGGHIAATPEDIALPVLQLEDLDERLNNLTFEHTGEHPTDDELDVDVARFLEAIR